MCTAPNDNQQYMHMQHANEDKDANGNVCATMTSHQPPCKVTQAIHPLLNPAALSGSPNSSLYEGADDEQGSEHSSSLESADEADMIGGTILRRPRHLGVPDNEQCSSTSASCDSFEMASLTLSTSQYLVDEPLTLPADLPAPAHNQVEPVNAQSDTTASVSTDQPTSASASVTSSFRDGMPASVNTASITEQLDQLDTALPVLDFDQLEKKLTDAAKENQGMQQRRMTSEQVRMRLAQGECDDSPVHAPNPAPATNQCKRAQRRALVGNKRANMHMQLCYVNSGTEQSSDSGDDTPCTSQALPQTVTTRDSQDVLGTEVCMGDSSKTATEHRQSYADQTTLDSDRLETETCAMLQKAKQSAILQMQIERHTDRQTSSNIEQIVGVNLSGRLTRAHLTKMGITQLQLIVNDMYNKIQADNERLVDLLVERDSLHMEQDSMLVDVEDLLQHAGHKQVHLPDFLVRESTQNGRTHTVFKR